VEVTAKERQPRLVGAPVMKQGQRESREGEDGQMTMASGRSDDMADGGGERKVRGEECVRSRVAGPLCLLPQLQKPNVTSYNKLSLLLIVADGRRRGHGEIGDPGEAVEVDSDRVFPGGIHGNTVDQGQVVAPLALFPAPVPVSAPGPLLVASMIILNVANVLLFLCMWDIACQVRVCKSDVEVATAGGLWS
jgi:hypothetical protein